jgi:hypothetical protein
MINWRRFFTPNIFRQCSSILGFVGILGFSACLGLHVCMSGHLCHGEDGNSGFYFDAVWFLAILLSMACSIESNLWLKPLFFCSFAGILTWWIVQIFLDRQIDSDYFSMSFVLVVLILCIRGLKWPSKNKVELNRKKNGINTFINIIAYIVIASLFVGLILATKHGIENPLRQLY